MLRVPFCHFCQSDQVNGMLSQCEDYRAVSFVLFLLEVYTFSRRKCVIVYGLSHILAKGGNQIVVLVLEFLYIQRVEVKSGH